MLFFIDHSWIYFIGCQHDSLQHFTTNPICLIGLILRSFEPLEIFFDYLRGIIGEILGVYCDLSCSFFIFFIFLMLIKFNFRCFSPNRECFNCGPFRRM